MSFPTQIGAHIVGLCHLDTTPYRDELVERIQFMFDQAWMRDLGIVPKEMLEDVVSTTVKPFIGKLTDEQLNDLSTRLYGGLAELAVKDRH